MIFIKMLLKMVLTLFFVAIAATATANGNIVKIDCDPKTCPPIDTKLGTQLQSGERVQIETVNCCPVAKKICDTKECPSAVEFCDDAKKFPASVVQGRCCKEYKCDFNENKCIMDLNGERLIKSIGEKWNDKITCTSFECLIDDLGETFINSLEISCSSKCPEGFSLEKSPDHCCPQCVQSKCKFDDKFYNEGDTWKSVDNCTFYECIKQESILSITSFKKTCPKLTNCPIDNVYTENCCNYCKPTKRNKDWVSSDKETIGTEYMDENLYKNHPCLRECVKGEKPMKCYYNFLVEWYETLSKACYECPYNATDCERPHCIPGDGVKRSVLVVNRMMPGPSIEVCENDIIIVDVPNHLLGESTTIHWHGLHQKNTPYMDGVPHVSQCPINPWGTFRYTFKADNAGTHFWHSHTGMQRGDGSFGSLIVRKAEDRHAHLYDYDLPDHIMILNDWAHQPGVSLFTSHHHSDGDNKPPNILVNGKGKYFHRFQKLKPLMTTTTTTTRTTTKKTTEMPTTTEIPTTIIDLTTNTPKNVELLHENSDKNLKLQNVTLRREKRQSRTVNFNAVIKSESRFIPLEVFNVNKGSRYRFRLINAEFLNCPMEISIDNHNITVISSDGFDIKPIEVNSLVSYAGERFDFIINADQPVDNYWIKIRGLMDCDERFTSAYQMAVLRYKGASKVEPENFPEYNFEINGLQMNALNKGTGYNDTVSIAETTSADQDDYFLLKNETDFKFYIYYDFYAKDNPHFHVPDLYGINQIQNSTKKLFTPQLNHISMKMPNLPLMPAKDETDESGFCNASSLAAKGINCREEFCECSHVLQIPLHATVEMILIDEGFTFDANHPFHLHGNGFRVVGMERIAGNITAEEVQKLDEEGKIKRRLKGAPLKDTVTIPDGGYTIIRFIASNPGYWLFHCHIEFHAEIGMALVLKVGEAHQMKPVPRNFPTCNDYKPSFNAASSSSFHSRLLLVSLILLRNVI